jgi:hypothetical protein
MTSEGRQQPDSLGGLYYTEATRAKVQRMQKLLDQIAAECVLADRSSAAGSVVATTQGRSAPQDEHTCGDMQLVATTVFNQLVRLAKECRWRRTPRRR